MQEKLTIKNFGPIKSAEIEIRRFTILIGEQATGKSTVAKLLAICRYFSYLMSDRTKTGFMTGLINWGLVDYFKDETEITYTCPDYEFRVDAKGEKVNETRQLTKIRSELEPKSPDFINLLKNARSFGIQIPPSFYLDEISGIMDNPYFLPVERGLQSIFSLGQDSIRNISNSLFNQFSKLDQIAKIFSEEVFIEPLGITYKNDFGGGFIRRSEHHSLMTLSNAASGYQSAIPIVLALKYYHWSKRKNKTFIIEEPELNLFPKTQKELIYFLVEEINIHQYDSKRSSILMTTHSPYILTSMSNLMTAFNVGSKENKKEQVAKILEKTYWLNPEDVSAYMLKPDGTIEDIVDREEGLINAEKIDSISQVLSEEFDQLLKIEFSEND